MKRFFILLLICLPLCAASADTARTRARIRHIRELVARQKGELADTKNKLDLALQTIQQAQTQINAVAKERDQWQAYGNDQHDRFMAADKKLAATKAAILRRDILIALLAIAIGVFLVIKFKLWAIFAGGFL